MKRRAALSLAFFCASILAAGPAAAAWFLKMEKPTGETETIELDDFDLGGEHAATIGSSTQGAGAGKIRFNEFTIRKTNDSASPAFFKNCVAGSHYKTVTLAMRKAGGDPKSTGKPFLVFRFSTVFVKTVNAADHHVRFRFEGSEVEGVPTPTPTPAVKVVRPGGGVQKK